MDGPLSLLHEISEHFEKWNFQHENSLSHVIKNIAFIITRITLLWSWLNTTHVIQRRLSSIQFNVSEIVDELQFPPNNSSDETLLNTTKTQFMIYVVSSEFIIYNDDPNQPL